MKRSVCDYCGRIAGAHTPMSGWFIEIPDHVDDPWGAACSEECVSALGYDKQNLAS